MPGGPNIEPISAVDRHRFDADPYPDTTFHFDVDPDPDWHQNNADPLADLAQSFTEVRKFSKIFLLCY
jgi:hypothetical protein